MNPIRFPDGLHGVIVVHPFGKYREADFLDDPEVIDALIADGEGWRVGRTALHRPCCSIVRPNQLRDPSATDFH